MGPTKERRESHSEIDPFLSLARDASATLKRSGFGMEKPEVLATCLRRIYRTNSVKAVVLSLAKDMTAGMPYPPIIEFNVYLVSRNMVGSKEHADIVEAHKFFAVSILSGQDTELHVLNPNEYPPPRMQEDAVTIRTRKFIAEIIPKPV